MSRIRRPGPDPDSELTAGDWVLCILCSGIGCIVGIVYMTQGKPKGGKMFGISLAASFVWFLIRVLLTASMGAMGP
jgi:hypothetical protein